MSAAPTPYPCYVHVPGGGETSDNLDFLDLLNVFRKISEISIANIP